MCAQVPKRQYTLEELRLNSIEAERLLSPTDNTLSTVRTALQACGSLVIQAESVYLSCIVWNVHHRMLALHDAILA